MLVGSNGKGVKWYVGTGRPEIGNGGVVKAGEDDSFGTISRSRRQDKKAIELEKPFADLSAGLEYPVGLGLYRPLRPGVDLV